MRHLVAITALSLLAACGKPAEENPAQENAEMQGTAMGEAPAPASSETPDSAGDAEPAQAAAGAAPPEFAQCAVCHSTKPGENGIGPSLAGVYGHKAAEVEGFAFSKALKDADLTLDDATLNAYLESPMKAVPGTKMAFAGIKDPAKRQAVIDYLKTI